MIDQLTTDQLAVDIELPLRRFTLNANIQTRQHMTGLFGRSGSGKTSFLEVIAGLRRNAVGTVKLGQTVWQDTRSNIFVPTEQRGIGYVPQEGLLFPHLSVEQNLRYGHKRAVGNGATPDSTFANVVDLLELGNLLNQNSRTLSGGERQRVALGRALCSGPRILLLDEPLAALDEALRRKILPFIRRIRDEFAIPMILVSHDTTEVQALCDELLLLDDGQIIAHGNPREILVESAGASIGNQRGFENIIPCATTMTNDELTVVELGANGSGVSLRLTGNQATHTQSRYVSIPARDIMLATRKLESISAQNIHRGRIEKIYRTNQVSLVTVSLGEQIPPLVAEITSASCADLRLAPGQEVFVVIKSMACTLYEDHFSNSRQPSPAS